jgi:hypothetical protein
VIIDCACVRSLVYVAGYVLERGNAKTASKKAPSRGGSRLRSRPLLDHGSWLKTAQVRTFEVAQANDWQATACY